MNQPMLIENARVVKLDGLYVTISGYSFWAGDKYTILELGWAVYINNDIPKAWLLEFGENRPADDEVSALESGNGMLITSHPILVALALRAWWHRNGRPIDTAPIVEIPTLEEAIEELKRREILNPWNERHANSVPGTHHKK
jgi:hypothetical protein